MRIVFMGTPNFAVSIVDAIYEAGHEIVLCVTQPDKPKGRSGQLQPPEVKQWALAHGVPVYQPQRIRRPEALEELGEYQEKQPADIAVVAAFGQILPQEVLDLYPHGCVNVHASLLPRYRGAAPIQWAVINGDPITGVTTMQMGPGLDDGDILLQRECVIAADETGGSLFDRLAGLGAALITETLTAVADGTLHPIPQDEALATHVGMIHKDMGHIDFTRPAVETECLIRGLNPWPSAYTTLDGKMLKVWRASVCEADLRPGEVAVTDDQRMLVGCSSGALEILELQLEGKKRMSTQDFLRGRKIAPGTILGR